MKWTVPELQIENRKLEGEVRKLKRENEKLRAELRLAVGASTEYFRELTLLEQECARLGGGKY
jgi:predicted RNase H-like nuclease (RuvC/YqgF family)